MTKKQPNSENAVSELKQLIGVVAFEMVNTITDDIINILSRRKDANFRVVESALDGYILALSRIVEQKVAWRCIVEAFGKCSFDIPVKYYRVFGVELEGDKNASISDAARRSGE